MRFYFSALFVSVILYVFVTLIVFIGLAIGYGWHIGSELYNVLTSQREWQGIFSDTAITVTITALLLPYLAAGYIAARTAPHAEYFNAVIAAIVLIGPFAFFYRPLTQLAMVAFSVAAIVMLVGATVAYWTRVHDEKRLAKSRLG